MGSSPRVLLTLQRKGTSTNRCLVVLRILTWKEDPGSISVLCSMSHWIKHRNGLGNTGQKPKHSPPIKCHKNFNRMGGPDPGSGKCEVDPSSG